MTSLTVVEDLEDPQTYKTCRFWTRQVPQKDTILIDGGVKRWTSLGLAQLVSVAKLGKALRVRVLAN